MTSDKVAQQQQHDSVHTVIADNDDSISYESVSLATDLQHQVSTGTYD